jgi:1,4-alpha-glucan branching enzyme
MAKPALHRAALANLVIYEMEIGTFAGNSGKEGSFQTAIGRLSQVAALGFNAVEVMPVVENPPGNIGYGPSDQYAVQNEIYGGPITSKPSSTPPTPPVWP